MKATTMTLTAKRRTVFPLEGCRRESLERGGPLNVFDLGKAGFLVRPLRPPARAEVKKLLAKAPAGCHPTKQTSAIVNRALREVRR